MITEGCLAELYLLPPIAFFKQTLDSESIMFEKENHFTKQTFRNRFTIMGANGIQNITIPVDKSTKKQLYKDVKLNFAENWLAKNNTSLKSAYANSPFFEDYYPYFQNVLNKKHTYLFELNFELIELCFKVLQFDKIINTTSSFKESYTGLIDFREIATSKKKKPEDWIENDIKSYQQVFGNKFVSNLSIIDLIFCEGPMSINYLS